MNVFRFSGAFDAIFSMPRMLTSNTGIRANATLQATFRILRPFSFSYIKSRRQDHAGVRVSSVIFRICALKAAEQNESS